MDGNVHFLGPREARRPTETMSFSERTRLAGLHGELAISQMQATRASAEFALTGSDVDRQVALGACAQAIEALQNIALLLTATSSPSPTEPQAA